MSTKGSVSEFSSYVLQPGLSASEKTMGLLRMPFISPSDEPAMCQPGPEALPAKASSEDPSVQAATDRWGLPTLPAK